MALKDLFGKATEKVVTKQQLQDLYNQAESQEYIEQILEDKERYLPAVDFSSASNFAHYGSAEKYYVDAIKNIYQNYPYDGSKKEKQEWRNGSSQLDLYIFDEVYPKTTGYVSLSSSATLSNANNYRSSSAPQYIKIKGGPNPSSTGKFETANLYDLDANRESNLGITAFGNTIEFWFKDDLTSSNANYNYAYALFDLWNGVTASSADYTRLALTKVNGSNKFAVTYRSGSAGLTAQELDYTFDSSTWHHYAFSFANYNSNDLEVCLYVDGNQVLRSIYTGSGSINLANNAYLVANIGALRADLISANTASANLGSSYGSYDEFRFWKSARTSQQIYRNWNMQVGGGANTDDSNKDLGVYLRFNEGIVDSTDVNDLDKICLDYSGRVSNGTIINYVVSSKNTGSAIDTYFGVTQENKDPIIFSGNPLVQTILQTYTDLGFQYDQGNVSNIYKTFPAWITEEAEKNGYQDLSQLIQIISSYFDTLYLQIQSLSTIKNLDYNSNSEKPKPFAKHLLSSNGFENLELFNDTTFLEDVLSRNDSEEFVEKIHDIKNAIYQNIYNNLSYIYKSKGTEKSLRNLIRCFGVDDELIKINLYADNAEYNLENKYTYTTTTKKFVDFNNPDRNIGYIYQKAKVGDSNTYAFIPGSATNYLDHIPLTLQAEIIFPKNPIIESENYNVNNFQTSSLYGVHTALGDPNDFSWDGDDFNFQVYSVRKFIGSEEAYFLVTGSFAGYPIQLTSSIYKDVYDNQKWNLAVRIKPENYPHNNLTSGSGESDYTFEFIGINSIADSINNSFSLSASVPNFNMVTALAKNKRVYAGAHYTDFDNTRLEHRTDVKISSVRFWFDYITDTELIAHSYNAANFGRLYPNWPATFIASLSGSLSSSAPITKFDTLALHWSFFNVSSSDSNGKFIVDDVSSGSLEAVTQYGLDWFGGIAKYQFPGFADKFLANDSQVVNKEYVFSVKQQNPETLNGNDLVQILDTDDVTRVKNSKPIQYYISIEKSMAQVLNDEIMNWFAAIKSYNNLIGEPLERYKHEYSGLQHLRELFFSKVDNSINFEKFFEFYKWIDSWLSTMISQLVPATANTSNKVHNVIESHMLERSKYTNKLPTIEFKGVPDSSSIEPYAFSVSKLQSLDDTINPINISNNLFNSQFIFASASITQSGQIVQPIKKKGNYYHSYEYLFTSGRTANNKSFVDLEGNITGSSTTYTLGFTDTTLPNRSVNKQIIVERFSSPGGPEVNGRGYLDDAAEEYSVYNSLNYRNSRVRKVLNAWMAESASIDENYPSYHQVNKNPTYIPISETSSLTEPYYDNSFVQHAIPRSEAQYSWITASLATKPSASGYISEFDNLNYDYEFLSASNLPSFTDIPFVNFRYFGDSTTDAVLTDKIYNTTTNTISGGELFGAFTYIHTHFFLTSLNGPYQHPSWKQIRNYENPFSIISRKNNNILVQDSPKQKTRYVNGKAETYLNTREETFTSFKEPPVTYNKPMTQKIVISGSNDPIELATTYDNNKERFANIELAKRTGVGKRSEPQTHDILLSLERNKTYEPNPEIVEAEYTTQIYPAKENTGLKEVRTKPNYDDFGSTESVTDIRSYWHENYVNRKRITDTIDLFGYTTSSYAALTDFTGSIMGKYPVLHKISGNINASIYALDNLTGSVSEYTASIANARTASYDIISSSLNMTMSYGNVNKGILAPYSLPEHRYFLLDPDYNKDDISYIAKWDSESQIWSNDGITKLNGDVTSLYYDTNTNYLYAGGNFTADVKGNVLSHIAYWDGTDWNSLNGQGVGDIVRKIISGSDGIYFCGDFTISTIPTTLNFVAKWDGNNITALSTGLNSIAHTIHSSSNGIYVGGNFTNKIKKWDGFAWSDLGTGISVGTNGQVLSIINYTGSYIAVGGLFSKIAGISIASNCIGFYNTSSNVWVAAADAGLNNYVYDLASYNNGIIVCGAFSGSKTGNKQLNKFAIYSSSGEWEKLGVKNIIFEEYQFFPYRILYDLASNKLYTAGITYLETEKYNTFGYDLNTEKLFGLNLGLNNSPLAIIKSGSSADKYYFGGQFTRENSRTKLQTELNLNTFEGYKYLNSRLLPRPQLVFNNHLPSSTGSSAGGMLISDTDRSTYQKIITYNDTYPESLFFLNDAYIYEVDKKADKINTEIGSITKKPFFNTYDEYHTDLKPNNKQYSIVPEYKISDYTSYYIKQKNGNFYSPLTSSYLSIDGAALENDFNDINSTLNKSNVLNGFLLEDITGSNNKINFTVSGIKKMLPYNGFYPSERVKDLSSKFINSFLDLNKDFTSIYSDIQTSVDYNTSNGTPIDQQILTLLQPLFAPGILLNSIKSSIAVDWPTFITNSVAYSSSNKPIFYNNSGSITTNHTATLFIDKEPNYRFNFESLLEFDSLIPEELQTTSSNLYYLNPTYYSTDVVTGSDRTYLRYPSYNMNSSGSLKSFVFNNADYKLAMHNFLAEVPNFFLKDNLSKFVSAPENKFQNAIEGVTYYMDIVLERDTSAHKEYVMDPFYEAAKLNPANYASGNILTLSPDSLYGPPVRYWNNISVSALTASGYNNLFFKQIDTPSYAPYVPPYYYGKAIARIAFTADASRQYSLEEIQQSSSITYINEDAEKMFAERSNFISSSFTAPYTDNYSSSPAYKQMMKLSSSVNLLLKTENNDPTFDAANSKLSSVGKPNNINNSWVIQTKFETPSLNFINADKTTNIGLNFIGGNKDTTNQFVEGIYSNLFKGLWTTYGEPVKDGQGIKLYITDTYKKNTRLGTGSLAELCGFRKDEKRTIGLVDDNKVVTEGVVVIPYTFINNHKTQKSDIINDNYARTIPELLGENGLTNIAQRGNGPYYFAIDRNTLKEIIGLSFSRDSKVSFDEIKRRVNSSEIDQNNSIVKLVKAMTNYVIPPHLDWIRNKEINPFVMYVAEFSTVLDTEDLADIWQGLMPKPAYTATKEEINISHDFGPNELFHGKKIPNDLKFKVFKVKQKAEINYYKLTEDSRDDSRFSFSFDNSGKASIPDYSYNWPYDYFSLVELINIDASLKINKENIQPTETVINPEEIVKALQQTDTQKAIKDLGNKIDKKNLKVKK